MSCRTFHLGIKDGIRSRKSDVGFSTPDYFSKRGTPEPRGRAQVRRRAPARLHGVPGELRQWRAHERLRHGAERDRAVRPPGGIFGRAEECVRRFFSCSEDALNTRRIRLYYIFVALLQP